MTQPALADDVVERETAARVTRQAVLRREPPPTLSFVQEQVTL
ncbi:Scr1 family TA system antitoxin-like transcriptional regulator [Streptomyces coelicoflavus]